MNENKIPPVLIHVNDQLDGYHRIKKRRKFIYTNGTGKAIASEKLLSRFNKLVIPPKWKNVWICKNPKGHIQVTGEDEKGRKQYIYHPIWKEYFSEAKYNGLLHFGECLPAIRKQLEKDLKKKNWDKRKVVALAIQLMDEYHLRVGNKFYEEKNQTYGVTTLRRKHVVENKNELILKYTAKSGKLQKVTIDHPKLKRLVKQCSELPGYELFRYKSGNKYHAVDSNDINAYLKEVSGENITAKYFRTWGGTVAVVELAQRARQICNETPRKKMETTLLQLAAEHLNNTVSVCRKHYIHPEVLKTVINNYKPPKISRRKWYNKSELIVLSILKNAKNGNLSRSALDIA